MKRDENSETDEKKISKIKYIYLLYKQNPRFKALVKLCLYFILIFVILLVVGMSDYGNENNSSLENRENKEVTEDSKSYKEILESTLINGKKFNYEITYTQEKYLLNYTINDEVITGLYEDQTGTLKKFTMKENMTYEITLNEEKENETLLNNMNMSYVNIYNLIGLLGINKSVKMLESDKTVYKYTLDTASINVFVIDEKINEIDINENDFSYIITIE